MRIAIVLVAALACACGDDGPSKTPDAGTEGDAMPDAGEDPTFTSYVIDLITNGTSGTESARPYAEFESLPDPDGNNADAYQSLF